VRIMAACTLALVSAHLVAAPVRADQLRMECQVANFKGEHYTFLFDTPSGSLSVNMQSSVPPIPLLGFDVKKWKLLFAQGGHTVFYAITPEGLSSVQKFSLNFENLNMFHYQMGGDAEEAIAGIPQYKA
jgi:hypothetical protein